MSGSCGGLIWMFVAMQVKADGKFTLESTWSNGFGSPVAIQGLSLIGIVCPSRGYVMLGRPTKEI